MNKILHDSQANINMFCNPDLLTRIRKEPREMTVHYQSGSTSTDLIDDYELLGLTVWFNPDGIANILSLSKLIRLNKVKVEYDSRNDVFNVFDIFLGMWHFASGIGQG